MKAKPAKPKRRRQTGRLRMDFTVDGHRFQKEVIYYSDGTQKVVADAITPPIPSDGE